VRRDVLPVRAPIAPLPPEQDAACALPHRQRQRSASAASACPPRPPSTPSSPQPPTGGSPPSLTTRSAAGAAVLATTPAGAKLDQSSALLVKAVNAALGLDLVNIIDVRLFLASDEGNMLLDTWLAAHLNDGEDNGTTPTERTA
jgi:hypothetical protein